MSKRVLKSVKYFSVCCGGSLRVRLMRGVPGWKAERSRRLALANPVTREEVDLQVLSCLELLRTDVACLKLLRRCVDVGKMLFQVAIVAIRFSAFWAHRFVLRRPLVVPPAIPVPGWWRVHGEPRRTRPRPWNPIIHQSRCPNTVIQTFRSVRSGVFF